MVFIIFHIVDLSKEIESSIMINYLYDINANFDLCLT